MREGSLDAPTRHPLAWKEADFWDAGKLDDELRRAFDICHGCRRCFNLCDSFPKLFDLIDESDSGELDSVDSKDFKPVIDACTLCDMCFLTKCPYVPPHEFDLDFPHLMLRARAQAFKAGKVSAVERQLTKTDRNGKMGCSLHGIANWATKTDNSLTRGVMEAVAGIDKNAALPTFNDTPLTDVKDVPAVNTSAPAHGRKAVIYATCFSNYNNARIGAAARGVLAQNGVETELVHPRCCGMPQLEHGDIEAVAQSAEQTAADLKPWIEKGYDVIAVVSSCALMLKFEWPLIMPGNEDVKTLAATTFDVGEYVMDIAKKEGLADGLQPLDGGITMHVACHARAQNMGQKGAELLRQIPDTDVKVIERCSGHGGSWGVMKGNFETALKVGKPVFRDTVKAGHGHVVSECPLARDHILQGMDGIEGGKAVAEKASGATHPIELMALSYGL